MEKSTKERDFVCKYCNKKFPSGKSLGGHIKAHSKEYSLDSHKRFVSDESDHREIVLALKQQQQHCCGEKFESLKALCSHDMGSHSNNSLSDSESKRVVMTKQSDSESLCDESSSCDSEIEEEHKNMALSLMMMSRDSKGYNFLLNSVILETESSSREQLKKIFNVKNHLRYDDDEDSSDSDYFMNGPKKSDSDKSLKRFKSIEELGVVEMSKIHRSSDSNSKASSVVKKSKGCHECPICFRVFASGQALGGHKRSHSFDNQELKKKRQKKSKDQVTETHRDLIDLNLVPTDIDE